MTKGGEEPVDDIVVTSTDGIGTVRLNRPDRGNSVTPDVVTRWATPCATWPSPTTISAVVLTGTGSVFCAGADVKDMFEIYSADGPDALMEYLGRHLDAGRATHRATALVGSQAFDRGVQRGCHRWRARLRALLRRAAGARSARFAESYVNLGHGAGRGGRLPAPVARRAVGGDQDARLRRVHRRR